MTASPVNQHIDRLARLYRTAASAEMDCSVLRMQLIEAASHVGPATAELSTPQACEDFITRLRGLARLALNLRAALEGNRDAT